MTFADPVVGNPAVDAYVDGAVADGDGAWVYFVHRGQARIRVGLDGIPQPGTYDEFASYPSTSPDCNEARCLKEGFPSYRLLDRDGHEVATVRLGSSAKIFAWPGGFLAVTYNSGPPFAAFISNDGRLTKRDIPLPFQIESGVWDGGRFVLLSHFGFGALDIWTADPATEEVQFVRTLGALPDEDIHSSGIVWNGSQYLIALVSTQWPKTAYLNRLATQRLNAALEPLGLSPVDAAPVDGSSVFLAPISGGAVIAWQNARPGVRAAAITNSGIVSPPPESGGSILLRKHGYVPQVLRASAASADASLAVWSEPAGESDRLLCARVSSSGVRLDSPPILLDTLRAVRWTAASSDGSGFLIAWMDGVTLQAAYLEHSGGIRRVTIGDAPPIASLQFARGEWHLAMVGGASQEVTVIDLNAALHITGRRVIPWERSNDPLVAAASDGQRFVGVSESVLRSRNLTTGESREGPVYPGRDRVLLRDAQGEWIVVTEGYAFRIDHGGSFLSEAAPLSLPVVVSINGRLYATQTVVAAQDVISQRVQQLDFATLQPLERPWILTSHSRSQEYDSRAALFSAASDARSVYFSSSIVAGDLGNALVVTAQEIDPLPASRPRPIRH